MLDHYDYKYNSDDRKHKYISNTKYVSIQPCTSCICATASSEQKRMSVDRQESGSNRVKMMVLALGR